MYYLQLGVVTHVLCDVQFLSMMCDVQGHSTASSLPPLPENGPTEETQLQEEEAKGDHSPVPSANTSHVEEVEEEGADEV